MVDAEWVREVPKRCCFSRSGQRLTIALWTLALKALTR